MSTPLKALLAAAFFAVVFVGVPMFIAATGRNDLYYTLTSVALLSIIRCYHGPLSSMFTLPCFGTVL